MNTPLISESVKDLLFEQFINERQAVPNVELRTEIARKIQLSL